MSPAPHSCRVLVVDDHHQFRRMIGLVFHGQADIEIVGEALDGLEAIELAREHQPDVVLLDVAMPEMDGLEALPHILKASPRSTVVMLTGFAQEEVRNRAMAAGAFSFIEKGSTPMQIVRAVRDAC